MASGAIGHSGVNPVTQLAVHGSTVILKTRHPRCPWLLGLMFTCVLGGFGVSLVKRDTSTRSVKRDDDDGFRQWVIRDRGPGLAQG